MAAELPELTTTVRFELPIEVSVFVAVAQAAAKRAAAEKSRPSLSRLIAGRFVSVNFVP